MNSLTFLELALVFSCVYGLPLFDTNKFNNYHDDIHYDVQDDEQHFDYLNDDEKIEKTHFKDVSKEFDSFMIELYKHHSLYNVDS